MKAEQRAAVDGAFEPGRGDNAGSWRGAGDRDNQGGRRSSLPALREGVPTYQSLHVGMITPSAGPITAASLGQKQARMKERTEAFYPASNHPLALREWGLSTVSHPPSHFSPTWACQSAA